MLRFLHAADFHLDSPFRSLAPEQAAARRRESRELLVSLIERVELTEDKEIIIKFRFQAPEAIF